MSARCGLIRAPLGRKGAHLYISRCRSHAEIIICRTPSRLIYLFACVRSVWASNKNRWCFHARHRGEMLHINAFFIEPVKHACCEREDALHDRAHTYYNTHARTPIAASDFTLFCADTAHRDVAASELLLQHSAHLRASLPYMKTKIPQKQQFLMHFLLAFWITVFTNISASPHEFFSYLSSIENNGPCYLEIYAFQIQTPKIILTFRAKSMNTHCVRLWNANTWMKPFDYNLVHNKRNWAVNHSFGIHHG